MCHMTFRREQVLGKKNQHNSITNFLFGYSATCVFGVVFVFLFFVPFLIINWNEVDFNSEVHIFFWSKINDFYYFNF